MMRIAKYLVIIGIISILTVGCGGAVATHKASRDGSQAFQAGDYETALHSWQNGLQEARANENRSREAIFLYNIGLTYDKLNQYSAALRYYQEALICNQTLRNHKREAHIANNIGIVYSKTGFYQRAVKSYQQALQVWEQLHNQEGKARTLNNLGAAYHYLGQFQEALYAYRQSLAIKRQREDLAGESLCLNNIGSVFWHLGSHFHPQAYEHFQQSLDIHRRVGNKAGEGSTLNNLGAVLMEGDMFDEALSNFQSALRIRQEIGDILGEGHTLSNIGSLYVKTKEYSSAFPYFQQALTLREQIGDVRGQAATLLGLGILYHETAQDEKAYQTVQDSRRLFERVGIPSGLWVVYDLLGQIEEERGHPEQAVRSYEQALDAIEALRSGLTEKTYQVSFMEDKFDVYDRLIFLLYKLHQAYPDRGYDHKSFEIFERKQGRLFLEEVGKSGARFFAGLPHTIRQQEEELELRKRHLQEQLAAERANATPDTRRLQSLEQDLNAIQHQQQVLQASIRRDYPKYYDMRYPQPVTLHELQQQVLQTDEVMLVYGVMRDVTILWAIERHRIAMLLLPVGEEELQSNVTDLRNFMLHDWEGGRGLTISTIPSSEDDKTDESQAPQLSKREQFMQMSHELYTQLLPETTHVRLTELNVAHVVLTGPLYALPFEILVSSTDPQRYVLEDIAVNYLSSASLLNTLRHTQQRGIRPAPYPFIGFAHPVYSHSTAQSKTSERSLRSQTYRDILKRGIAELPETAEEARDIVELFDASPQSQPLYLREKASHRNVFALNSTDRLDDYQYVLFAMHGIMPGEISQVNQSSLILSDDLLTMADVFGLRFNAKLVSLSACNTGRGEHVRGEGVMGLTRAFMYAGTPAVAVTLWWVDSLSAKALSIGMFRYITQGYAPAQALRAIKLDMLRGQFDEVYQHPYYWAPYILFGAGS